MPESPWVVCGRESSVHPWEVAAANFPDQHAAETWLLENYAKHPSLTSWYVDRDWNDGFAESYFDVQDGSLVRTN